MTEGLSPRDEVFEELKRLRRRAEWVPKRVFIEKVERKLRELNAFNRVVDSIALAKSLERVAVRKKSLGAPDVGGHSVKWVDDRGKVYGVITLNKCRKPVRLQWDCAHELIHLWFHPPNSEIDHHDADLMRIYEIQANWGAREIKLPLRLFVKKYAEMVDVEPDLERALADFFGVGIAPVRHRIAELMREGYLRPPRRERAKIVVTWDELRNFLQAQQWYWSQRSTEGGGSVAARSITDGILEMWVSERVSNTLLAVEADESGHPLNGGVPKMSDNRRYILPRNLFTECPRCRNADFHQHAVFCWLCGLPRFNECTRGNPDFDDDSGEVCGEYNRPDARYCEICGAQTYYYKIGFLPDWWTVRDDAPPPPTDDDFDPNEVPF